MSIFFFNATATTEIYTLSLHDALPILRHRRRLKILQRVQSRGAGYGDTPRFFAHLPQPHRKGRRRNEVEMADRKSTRLNSSHGYISYAVFCLKKKITNKLIS